MEYRCVIFDLDGTLADTIDDIAGNINRALAERGFPFAPVLEYIKMQGREIEALVLNALPPEARERSLAETIARKAIDLYIHNPLNLAKPYSGMPELLFELKRKKMKLAVLSNKPDIIAQAEIVRLFPPGTFDQVCGIREGFPQKPDPQAVWDILAELDTSPRNTLLVGDSETDVKAAQDSGCPFIGVSWGYRDWQLIKAAGAGRIINRPAELLEFL